MHWNLNDDRPIYQQLTERLTERIVSGALAPGGKVSAVRDLAAEAGVNPNTMQRALADLEREGLLYTNRTAGRFVTEDREMIEAVREKMARERIAAFVGSMDVLGFSREEIIALLQNTAREGEN